MEVRDNSVLTGIQFANSPELELVRVFPTVTTTTLGPPGGICGDPVDPFPSSITAGRTVTASDALFTLQAAVKTVSCELCVCDVNGSGSITAGDALFLLQRAVGQPVEFDCPPCL